MRILFAFDPWRSAILLAGGDKSGRMAVDLTQAAVAERMGRMVLPPGAA